MLRKRMQVAVPGGIHMAVAAWLGQHEEAPLFCPLNGCMKAGIYEDLEIDFSEMKL